MSWLALLLVGCGIADLIHSVRPVRLLPEFLGAAAVAALALASDLTTGRHLLALVVIIAVVGAWGYTVRDGFGRDRAWLPLSVLGLAILAALATAPLAEGGGGLTQRWLEENPFGVLQGLEVDRALLILGVLLMQMSSGNVIVRLVLRATGTVDPGRGASHDVTRTLKGGRLLGPMERLVIVGLGLAGHLTAASVVIAAKGLLRFPELQSKRDNPTEPTIDEVTEYFLVGSFVSWLVSLGSLVLLAG